ncbi:MAG: class I SAM-dependent RNA methyltransferase [Alphaproteobacteria bacterium]|nr:class I SAM-dependent RNA methyltransferase [Alphaproteobacteria bacterium]
MSLCPLFSVCGGCKFDFTSPEYRKGKQQLLKQWPNVAQFFWTPAGCRRRADFCFSDSEFGFFERGTKNIVPVKTCPNLVSDINLLIPKLAKLPWGCAGSALVTACENGIDLAVISNVPYFTREFKDAVQKLDLLRVSWNGAIVVQKAIPRIRFNNFVVDYPVGAFLQPTTESESAMRDFVIKHASGARHIADLFCGIGNFTYALAADGFDIAGIGVKRDLFKNPLTIKMLNTYDLIVMDPPRAGALAQVRELAQSLVPKVIYVSCNPVTLRRDTGILLKAGYKITDIAAFDQFVGTDHWELVVVFEK